MTWYITDRLFLVAASLCRLSSALSPYFVEGTIPHILLYISSFVVVYLFIFFTVSGRMQRLSGSEIPMQNALLSLLLVCILTPIFYFESQQIANYDLFFYDLLNVGEIIFYVFMLLLQVLTLDAANERTRFHVAEMLWLEEQKQYKLTKENIDALNIKCHDLKHQIRHLRGTGQVDSAYLDDLERSVSIYNSAVRTGSETLDVVLTDKRLHCATHDIQFTCMGEGDILLHSPEFDITEFQFCTDNNIEYRFFNLMESNYDALALLDLRQYDAVFTPLGKYLTVKDPMAKKSYALSASDFDEDGNPVDSPSYNEYGDYIVYRPNAASALPVYGAPVHYTIAAFPPETHIEPLNAVYRRFLDKGVTVYYTYSPRNVLALSDSSTPEARAELDRYLRETLCVPVITELENSLWSGVYLYGTDNHLSTEGAAIHTQRVIAALKTQMARDQSTAQPNSVGLSPPMAPLSIDRPGWGGGNIGSGGSNRGA